MAATTYHGPINENPGPNEASIIIFGYVPSLGLSISGIVLWFFVLVIQCFYLWGKRGYRTFHILMTVGSLMEMGGYISRLFAHYHPFYVSTFVAQYFLIVVAPVFFSAAIYLTLFYVAQHFEGTEKLFIIRKKLILAFFVTADVITTIIQIAGSALIGTSESAKVQGEKSSVTPEQASDILLAGLSLQTFSFLCFLTIASITTYRAGKAGFTLDSASNSLRSRLRFFLYTIIATSDLILLRTTFRLAEAAQGFFGTAATSEILYGILESLPVIVALIVWTVLPPARFCNLYGSRGLRSIGVGTSGAAEKGEKSAKGRRDGEVDIPQRDTGVLATADERR